MGPLQLSLRNEEGERQKESSKYISLSTVDRSYLDDVIMVVVLFGSSEWAVGFWLRFVGGASQGLRILRCTSSRPPFHFPTVRCSQPTIQPHLQVYNAWKRQADLHSTSMNHPVTESGYDRENPGSSDVANPKHRKSPGSRFG